MSLGGLRVRCEPCGVAACIRVPSYLVHVLHGEREASEMARLGALVHGLLHKAVGQAGGHAAPAFQVLLDGQAGVMLPANC